MNEILKMPEYMTLYEICKLTGTEHNKAMKRVMPEMIENQEFGTVAKMSAVYNDKNQTIETYQLNKRQSYIMAARLSNKFLCKVIDRWQELEQIVEEVNTGHLSKEDQKFAMDELQGLLLESEKGETLNYIKANTIVNKATSYYFGFDKIIKKGDMSNNMIVVRDEVLKDFITLFGVLGSMSDAKEALYKKYKQPLLGEVN